MKKLAIILVFVLFAADACAQETRTTSAVMDMEAQEGVSAGVSKIISDCLRTYLVNTKMFTIVTRENMDQILKEQNFQQSGCTSEQCIVQMGQLLGVRKMFTGSIGKVGSTYVINLKIIDIESGKIEGAVTEQCPKCEEDALLTSITKVTDKLINYKPAAATVVPAPSANPAAAANALEKRFKGRFGLGVNWPGIQVRYGLTDSFVAEGLCQFGTQNSSAGGRMLYLFDGFPGNISFFPYAGGGFIWVFSPLFQGGYTAGGFGGVELLVTKNIGIGGDIGLYYANVWGTWGTYADYGLIYNVGLTYYF